ncbi:MAG TPA: TIGR01777 family oxidoreductase [Spirochaetota bacterium]|nr:TIGR01777 family oxidoreductase [Spirochaetota bacterium]
MKVAVTGGLGFIGERITRDLLNYGYDVTVFARKGNPELFRKKFSYVKCDLTVQGNWQDIIGEHDVVVNLAGTSVFTRWNKTKKEYIYNSRSISTANIVEAMGRKKSKAKVLINASAVGFYGMHGDEEITEKHAAGDDFLAMVCRRWEDEAMKADANGARVVIMRFGTVLGGGGAFPLMKKVFGMMMGAKLGSGKQWFPWIHIDDVCGIILKAVKDKKMSGRYNCTAPVMVRNSEFTAIMAKSCGKPVIIPFVPVFALKIMMGEFGAFLAGGQKAVPEKLVKEKYSFQFPELGPALENLMKKS